jgi:hypothetical protein
LTRKGRDFPTKNLDSVTPIEVELSRIAPILMQRNRDLSQVAVFCVFVTGRLKMLGLIARWGHNVLIATMALLTIAMVVSLIR